MGLPTRRSRSSRCDYICFLVKLSYFIIHSLYRIAFSLSEKLLKCHPAKNHCFVFMICQIKRYPLIRFSLNSPKNCLLKHYFVRLNARLSSLSTLVFFIFSYYFLHYRPVIFPAVNISFYKHSIFCPDKLFFSNSVRSFSTPSAIAH